MRSPVNVARRDLCLLFVAFREEKRRPVIIKRLNSREPSPRGFLKNEYLASSIAFPIHLDEAGRSFHQAVQFRGKDVLVFTDTDVDGLTAALQSEKNPAGFQIACHGDGVGTLEIAHGQTESFREVMAGQEVFLDFQRNDFRVRCQLRGDEGPVTRLQIIPEGLVVVDVSVQDHTDGPVPFSVAGVFFQRPWNHHEVNGLHGEGKAAHSSRRDGLGAFRGVERGKIIDGVAVLFGDGPHGGPTRVGHG